MKETDAFVAIDFETTGFAPPAAEVIEIGAAKFFPDGTIERFASLVRPLRPVPAAIAAFTGISNRMVASAPEAEEAFLALRDFVEDLPLVAHNAGFEARFLPWVPSAWFDTLVLARSALPGLPDHRLPTVAEALGIPLVGRNLHRALADAELCGEVFRSLREAGTAHPTFPSRAPGARTGAIPSPRDEVLAMLRAKRSVREIAELRGVGEGTVERHIESLIAEGRIAVEDLLPPDRIAFARQAWERVGWAARLKEARTAAGCLVAFRELRWVRAAQLRKVKK